MKKPVIDEHEFSASAPAKGAVTEDVVDSTTGSITGAVAGALVGGSLGPVGFAAGALLGGALGGVLAAGPEHPDQGEHWEKEQERLKAHLRGE